MVFRRDRTQERKDWLYRENPEKKLSNNRIVDFADFLNNEVLEFSRANVIRSIPTIVDGMKPSQRKILFACMKKNLYQKEMKVAQLSGYADAFVFRGVCAVAENGGVQLTDLSLVDERSGMFPRQPRITMVRIPYRTR